MRGPSVRQVRHIVKWVCCAAVVAGLALLSAEPGFAKTATEIAAIRLGDHGSTTRLVLDMSGEATFSSFAMTGPDRLVIDLPETAWADGLKARALGLVKEAKPSKHKDASRLVITLSKPARIKSTMLLKPQDGKKYRLVFDLAPVGAAAFQASAEASKPTAKKTAETEPAKAKAPPPAPTPKPALAKSVPPVTPQSKTAAATPLPAPTVAPPPDPKPVQKVARSRTPRVPAAAAPVSHAPSAKPVSTTPAPHPASPPPTTTAEAPKVVAPPASPSADDRAEALPPPPKLHGDKMLASLLPPAPHKSGSPQIYSKPKRGGRRIIVVDAGHGGIDPGARAADDTLEKDIVLAAAKALGAALEATGRYQVVYTRTDDTFLKLADRVRVAREAGAALFISLHADALANDTSVRGMSIYTLSEQASDIQSARLAQKENGADIIGGVDVRDEPEDVTRILIDLAQRQTMDLSTRFAEVAVTDLDKSIRLAKNTHRSAGFKVLKAVDVPSCLIELGYLSNSEDLANLTSPDWRSQVASHIAMSVDDYFRAIGDDVVRRADAPITP